MNELSQAYCSTGSVLHRRKPFFALSQFWLVELRAGNDLPRRIAFVDGRRLWRVGGKDLADSPARTQRYTSTSWEWPWTGSVEKQGASVARPSFEQICVRILAASGADELPNSSHAELDQSRPNSVPGERRCSSRSSMLQTPESPSLPQRHSGNAGCFW